MITNNYYYGNNQNMNTGKFNGDNSQYNFTNQKPVPINQIKQKQRVYNSKPKTSSKSIVLLILKNFRRQETH